MVGGYRHPFIFSTYGVEIIGFEGGGSTCGLRTAWIIWVITRRSCILIYTYIY